MNSGAVEILMLSALSVPGLLTGGSEGDDWNPRCCDSELILKVELCRNTNARRTQSAHRTPQIRLAYAFQCERRTWQFQAFGVDFVLWSGVQ